MLGFVKDRDQPGFEIYSSRSYKGPVIIYGGGWHRREMFLVAKILLTQPLKSKKIDYPTSNIN
jgi:hypothetical protein